MNKGYYAIIPAEVRYDASLPANAKLLYGEITALCNEKGFCWASNRYFADLYGVSEKSISRWIAELDFKGYIHSEVIKSDEGTERKIYCRGKTKMGNGLDKNVRGGRTILGNGMDKNEEYNNTSNTTTNNTLKLSPAGAENDYEILDPYPFEEFWNLYDKKRGDKGKLQKKWEKLPEKVRQQIMEYLPRYIAATPDKKFRKDPQTFLNNKSWEDEIIEQGRRTRDSQTTMQSIIDKLTTQR